MRVDAEGTTNREFGLTYQDAFALDVRVVTGVRPSDILLAARPMATALQRTPCSTPALCLRNRLYCLHILAV